MTARLKRYISSGLFKFGQTLARFRQWDREFSARVRRGVSRLWWHEELPQPSAFVPEWQPDNDVRLAEAKPEDVARLAARAHRQNHSVSSWRRTGNYRITKQLA